jgi:hypothetical protein
MSTAPGGLISLGFYRYLHWVDRSLPLQSKNVWDIMKGLWKKWAPGLGCTNTPKWQWIHFYFKDNGRNFLDTRSTVKVTWSMEMPVSWQNWKGQIIHLMFLSWNWVKAHGNWLKLVPVALTHITAAPKGKFKLSPFKMWCVRVLIRRKLALKYTLMWKLNWQ